MTPAQRPLLRIVLADDHAILRTAVTRLIDAEPDMHVVGEAGTAVAAVAAVAEHQPDVLLLDISMPGGGLSALPEVRAASPATRVVVVTMHDSRSFLSAALAAGAAGYVVKSLRFDELLTAIRTVAGGRPFLGISLTDGGLADVFAQLAGEPSPSQLEAAMSLSRRERQVLDQLAQGYTHKEIASQLNLSPKTIDTYRHRLGQKLGLKSRAELVQFARASSPSSGDDSRSDRSG